MNVKRIGYLIGTPLFNSDNFQTMGDRINELITQVNVLTAAITPAEPVFTLDKVVEDSDMKPSAVSPCPDTNSIRFELLRQKYSVIHMALENCDKQMRYYRDSIENNPGSWNIVMNETHNALEDFKKLKEEGKIGEKQKVDLLERKTFAINSGKGFQIQFANGVVLSVQFGPYNYCEHYYTHGLEHNLPLKHDNWNSKDAEIAMWDKNKNWITKEFEDDGDDVIGYVGIEKFLKAIEWCKNRKE